jgi:predicted ATPase/class 3 adenylate cyclase
MGEVPSGTVTFLFTDVEGSTRRWEQDPQAMRSALAAHDEVLRSAVENEGGFLFKHTGDGICAAFSSANAAVAAAVAGQRALELPVRMGLATGNAELSGDDYHGPVLKRVARVMAAGHGGQILLAGSTAGLVDTVDLADLGAHRLRDLPTGEHLFQVRAPGLKSVFPALRTLDAVPGNLPVQSTSFVGREGQVAQLAGLVREHRLVTLTGVGGVGKTRLALEVAAWVVEDFPDGVWLVELAAIGDPSAVPDVVATTLGITARADQSVTQSVTEALVGRHLLLLLDNCEHVLGAAADLVEAILVRTRTVTIMATSREGLRVAAEHTWLVPSLRVEGAGSEGVALFVERAGAVNAGFSVADLAEAEAIEVICQRLDGIALAIVLAAARMVAMSAQDVRDRLDERFRLLAGGRRGLERHQTLRHAMAWSYDLLDDTERRVLGRCAVFAGGFDLSAAAELCRPLDDYGVLDVLDSLVRKSLVTVKQVQGHARYGLLETVRQFAEEQLGATGDLPEARDAHARYFAAQTLAWFERWDGPRQRESLDWVDLELPNLRAAFRWAADGGDVITATTLAAHTTIMNYPLAQWEPLGWAEEILPAAIAADVPQLPRLLVAAAFCVIVGRTEAGIGYAQRARELEADPHYDSCLPYMSLGVEAFALLSVGDGERALAILANPQNSEAGSSKFRVALRLWVLTGLGRIAEASQILEDAVAAVREIGNPNYIAMTIASGYGRVFAESDPPRALGALREAVEYSRQNHLVYAELYNSYELAAFEIAHGDLTRGLEVLDFTIDSLHRAGDQWNLAFALASLAICLERLEQAEASATVYGSSTKMVAAPPVAGLHETRETLQAYLGSAVLDHCVAAGAAMETGEAVAYARQRIRLARQAVVAAREA